MDTAIDKNKDSSDNEMSWAEAIVRRHSVRTYTDKKIGPETAALIDAEIDAVNAESGLRFQFVPDAGDTYNRLFSRAAGLGTAPSFIACAGPDNDCLDEQVGYYGERLVLFLQKLGLNTCWTGLFNKKGTGVTVGEGERLPIVIAVGYGKDQGRPRRSKTPEQVTEDARNASGQTGGEGQRVLPEWFEKGVEAALLAPTAINQQRFTIRLLDGDAVEIVDRGGPFSRIDLGIVKCHFELGSGRKVS